MNKVSQIQANEILAEAPTAIRKLAQARDFWKEKALSLMQADEVHKVAQAMMDRGLNSGLELHELEESLTKSAQAGKLATIALAVEMTGPDMAAKIASDHNHGMQDDPRLRLEAFLTGG